MDFYGHVIDGQEVPSLDGATMDDIDPYTREPWATIACGGKADADRAVAAARRAFDEGPWPRMGFEKRQAILHRLADLMEEHADELAMADTRDMGKPITQARHDVARSVLELPVLRRPCAPVDGRCLPDGLGTPRLLALRPGGRRRGDLAVELPAHAEHLEGRAGARLGQHRRPQARRGHARSRRRSSARLALEAGMPAGVLNVVHGYGPDSAGAALTTQPGRRPHHLHRRVRHGQDHQPVRGREPRPGQPRARRQGCEHRLRRCRHRQRRPLGGPGDLPQRRPGLPRRHRACTCRAASTTSS